MKKQLSIFYLLLFSSVFLYAQKEIENVSPIYSFQIPKTVELKIEWQSPKQNYISKQKNTTLKAIVTSEVKPQTVTLEKLNRDLGIGNTLPEIADNQFSYQFPIELSDGKNQFQLKVVTEDGTFSSDILTVFYEEPVDKISGNYYALLIGVSEYNDPAIPDLNENPINDAQSLYNTLTTFYTFPQDNVTILKNPTRRDIMIAFDKLAKTLTPNDNLLIFYAGHGYYEKENDIGYWLPADAERDFTANWLYNNNIVDLMKKIKAKHTLLIADACFSGSIFRGRDVNFMADAPKNYRQLYNLKSRNAMTSGTLKTVPNQSIFFEYLSKTLNQNTQKYITSQELYMKFTNEVAKYTNNIPQYGDIPRIGDQGGQFIFIRK